MARSKNLMDRGLLGLINYWPGLDPALIPQHYTKNTCIYFSRNFWKEKYSFPTKKWHNMSSCLGHSITASLYVAPKRDLAIYYEPTWKEVNITYLFSHMYVFLHDWIWWSQYGLMYYLGEFWYEWKYLSTRFFVHQPTFSVFFFYFKFKDYLWMFTYLFVFWIILYMVILVSIIILV